MSKVHCINCKVELYDHANCYQLAIKYNKLLEFIRETDFIELDNKTLLSLSNITNDSYVRRQAEYVLSLKSLLKEIGEL
jgi:hypothetical protein